MKNNNANTSPPSDTKTVSGRVHRLVSCDLTRKPLARGNIYQFAGYANKIKIKYVVFRGHEEDDGGLEGVAVDWIVNSRKRDGMFYPCSNDAEFFKMEIFANAYDPPANVKV